MNQLKHIFGLPVTMRQSIRLRSPSLNRSAGNRRKIHTTRSDKVGVGVDLEDSRELRISGKSYARLIADYNRAIQDRNSSAKRNCDAKNRRIKSGFFTKSPFERLAKVSSLVRTKSVGNAGSPSLSTRSSSPPTITKKGCESFSSEKGHLDERDVLEQVTERADWLDQVVKAHRVERAARNNAKAINSVDERNLAHPLVQKAVKSSVKRSGDQIGITNRRLSYVKPDNSVDVESVSVTVKSVQTSDSVKDKYSGINGRTDTMIVTVTEESKSTTGSLPLRHIDLKINDVPVTGMDSIVSRVEKLDIVSSAEKIEIRIPVPQDNTDSNQRSANPTINLCISGQINGQNPKSVDPRSKEQSSFFVTKIRSVETIEASALRSKVIPWWTTSESFRCKETISSNDPQISVKEGQSLGETKEKEVSGVNRKIHDTNEREVRIRNTDLGTKRSALEQSCPREFSKTRSGETTSGVSRIVENDLRKKSLQKLEENVCLGARKEPVMRPNAKIKNTNSTKETPSAVIDGTMVIKNGEASRKKVPSLNDDRKNVEGPKGKSMNSLSGNTEPNRNDNLSSQNSSKGSLTSKPMIPRVNPVESKQDISLKPKASLARSHLNVKSSSTIQSSAIPSSNRWTSIKSNEGTTNDADKVSRIKKCSIKPIDKKKDGSLIDHGLTVSSRKKLERKLPDSQSSMKDKKVQKKDAPAVVATIKEVIPPRNKDPRLIERLDKKKRERSGIAGCSRREETISRAKTNEPKTLLINGVKNDKNFEESSESMSSPDKKLLYSAWLRRHKEKDHQDPDSKKKGSDPCDS